MVEAISISYDQLYYKMLFTPHHDVQIGYWLAMNINPKPIDDLRQELQNTFPGLKLLTRGEAHITVITPVEYENILKHYLTMEDIDNIALQCDIQSSKFNPLYIGKGVGFSQAGEQIETYFIVVKSNDLIEIRKRIFDLYVKNGGIPSRFDPQDFTPHITIGFTERDLFESDGVFKQENSRIITLPLPSPAA